MNARDPSVPRSLADSPESPDSPDSPELPESPESLEPPAPQPESPPDSQPAHARQPAQVEAPPVAAQLPPRPPARRGLQRLVFMGVVPLLLLAAAAALYLQGGRHVETDNAYVKADLVPVSAEVSGTVRDVLVADNQAVPVGQLLFRLDTAPLRVAVDRAQARLGVVRTDLAGLRASYREKQAELALGRTRQEHALREQQRQAELVSRNFVSASRFDDARLNTELAGQANQALELGLARIAESLGGSVDAPLERHPAYRAALAELDQARLDLSRAEVRAAVAGVASKPPKPGQYVEAGRTAMALVAGATLWIEANYPETDLTHVRVGQPVDITVDTYPGQRWRGEVESLRPATGAEFSIIPAQNATGNWVKVAQRVPVRIRIVPADGQPALRAGLSTVVNIDTGHRRHLADLPLVGGLVSAVTGAQPR